MNKSAVARRYATALFNLLEPLSVERARDGLRTLSHLLTESSSLKHVLASPVFVFEEKRAVLNELSERSESPPVMKGFLDQLLKKNRVTILPEISHAFSELADQRKGIQQVWVSSGQPLGTMEQQDMQTQLRSHLHKDVEVTFRTDPNLVAGVQIQIGSQVFDNTVRGRLTKMRALLVKG